MRRHAKKRRSFQLAPRPRSAIVIVSPSSSVVRCASRRRARVQCRAGRPRAARVQCRARRPRISHRERKKKAAKEGQKEKERPATQGRLQRPARRPVLCGAGRATRQAGSARGHVGHKYVGGVVTQTGVWRGRPGRSARAEGGGVRARACVRGGGGARAPGRRCVRARRASHAGERGAGHEQVGCCRRERLDAAPASERRVAPHPHRLNPPHLEK